MVRNLTLQPRLILSDRFHELGERLKVFVSQIRQAHRVASCPSPNSEISVFVLIDVTNTDGRAIQPFRLPQTSTMNRYTGPNPIKASQYDGSTHVRQQLIVITTPVPKLVFVD